jgi:DNA-binding transcriptional MocR family regulator
MSGMFMWIRLHGVEDTDTFIQQTARNVKVLLVPGKAFSPNNKPSPYVRASFSLASQKVLFRFTIINDNLTSQSMNWQKKITASI